MGTVAGWLVGWLLGAVVRYRRWVISCLSVQVAIALLVVGPIVNIGLSCWEIHRLRTYWRVRLREAR